MREARLWVHVRPGARRTRAEARVQGRLRVAVAAPPRGGAANQELLAWLARALAPLPQPPRIVRGGRQRLKEIAFPGLSAAELEKRLEGLV